MSIILRPHQPRVVDYAIKHPYFICSVGVGGGKTPITLYLQGKLGSRMLVLCPAYLIPNWVDKIKQFCPPDIRVSVMDHKNKVYDLWDTDICLASYEWTESYEPLYKWTDFVVYEEGHYLKNMDAARTLNSHRRLFEYCPDRMMILTGTPIKSKVHEFYSLITMCNYNPRFQDPKFLQKFPNMVTFADHFSFRKEFKTFVFSKKKKKMVEQTVVKWEGLRNVDELKAWLKGIYIRVNRDEYMKTEKPIINHVSVDYKNEPDLLAEFERFTEYGSCNITAKMESAIAKVPFTIKYIEDILEKVDNVVVFTDFREPCKMIADHFEVPAITGEMDGTKRYELSVKFQNKESRIIVATIGSFSTGIDLFAAKDVVFNDICWIPGDLEQAIARVDRDGQTERCMVHLISGSYQDKKILQNIEKALEVINSVINTEG